jgi:hypothetical protein
LCFTTEIKSVYSAVRTGYLNKAVCASSLKGTYDFEELLSVQKEKQINSNITQFWKMAYRLRVLQKEFEKRKRKQREVFKKWLHSAG